jgi:hypothetical protein
MLGSAQVAASKVALNSKEFSCVGGLELSNPYTLDFPEKNTDWWYLRKGCGGEYLGWTGKNQDDAENCIMQSFITCALCQM